MNPPPFRHTLGATTRREPPLNDPRTAAVEVLDRLEHSRQTIDALIDAAAARMAGLSRRDRSLFNQLVYGVLRWQLRLDAVTQSFLDRPLKKTPAVIRIILRVGLFQILFMERIPASAAVNTAVNLARASKFPQAAGLVNALLRNVLRHPDRFCLPDAATLPLEHTAVAKSFPLWMITRWTRRWGMAATDRLCDAMNRIPPLTLRCNRLKNSRPELVRALEPQATGLEILKELPDGVNLIRPRCPIPQMTAFVEGRFAVQDGGAQLVSLLLAPQPGETVLDACAGLGGKATHLAQIMKNQGTLIAADKHRAKLAQLKKEASRLGVSIIRTQILDLNQPPTPGQRPRFDRILLDAPCSGLGVLRRNPDAKWSSMESDINRFAQQQQRFLDRLARLVRPGGCLVFAVCSIEPEENEAVIEHFLKTHVNFAITDRHALEEKAVLPFLNPNGFLRTVPHIHHLDGFFAARLQRTC